VGLGCQWGIHYLFVLSAWFWAGVCSAGRVGGQATQSGSTRTPSPAVAVVAVVGSTCYGLTPSIYPGGGAGNADHSILGETDKLRGIPEGQRYRSGVATSHEHQVVAWR
jgi:hypothetical protein